MSSVRTFLRDTEGSINEIVLDYAPAQRKSVLIFAATEKEIIPTIPWSRKNFEFE